MSYIYLILSVFMSASSNIFGKVFNRRNESRNGSAALYNILLTASVSLGWSIMLLADFSFDADVLRYSLLFAVCYLTATFGIIHALEYGPAALTSLFSGLSLILTTMWGFLFWDDALSVPVVIGFVLVIVSISLCLYKKESDEKAISLKWLIYASLAFFGNAGCSIVQRTQQLRYEGQHGNMMMLFAVGITAIVYLLVYLKSDKTHIRIILKMSWWIPICAGVCNVILNVLVMRLALSSLSPSLIYPVIGVGGIAVVTVFSLLVFREKMNLQQWCGIFIGAAAVALLSL